MSTLLFVHSELDDSGLDAESFRVLAHISRRAENGVAYAAVKSMANVCCMDKKTVINRLAVLEKAGWLIREYRPGRAAVYRIPPNPPDGLTHGTGEPAPSPNLTHGTGEHPTRGTGYEGNPIKVIPEGNPKIRARRATIFDPATLPLPFPSGEFRASWSEWCQHLREKKKSLGESAGAKQLKKLASIGEVSAIAAIDHSIERNWTGIYEPQASLSSKPTAPGSKFAPMVSPKEEW